MLNLSDIRVEVSRNSDLAILGQIMPGDLDLKLSRRHLNVGWWELRLPASHELAGVLRQPGARIIVHGPGDVLLSGYMTSAVVKRGPNALGGILTVKGVDDNALLAGAKCWPEPANGDPASQSVAYHNVAGPAETVMRTLVGANIGPSAPASRRTGLRSKLVLQATDLARGANSPKSLRFHNLGEALADIAMVAGLGFRVVQRGQQLVFEVTQQVDRHLDVVFTIQNDRLSSQEVALGAPGVTRVIVAGQGEGADRTILQRTSTESQAAEAAWGIVTEDFMDQRHTDDLLELQQAGDKRLTEAGMTMVAVRSVAGNQLSNGWGDGWDLGDVVSVEVEGTAPVSVITAATLVINADGVRLGVELGDPSGFDQLTSQGNAQRTLDSRLARLEANAETVGGGPFAPLIHTHDVTVPWRVGTSLLSPSTPATDYPWGRSIAFTLPQAGWPQSTYYGTVTTERSYGSNGLAGGTIQYWSAYQTGLPGVWFRQWNYTSGTPSWSGWQKLIAESDLAQQMWVPDWSGVTVGNGTVFARYVQAGKQITAVFQLVLGSTSAVTGDVSFSLPVPSHGYAFGSARLQDIGTTTFQGQAIAAGARCFVRRLAVSGGNIVATGLAANTPFTWAATDVIEGSITYLIG